MSSLSSKQKGLNEDEKAFITDNYGRITHYFEKSKSLDIHVVAEYEMEAKFATHFFEDETITKLSTKLCKITLWIECGTFLAVNLWHKMEHIIKLLRASKYIVHHLNIFLTHETRDANNPFLPNSIDNDNEENDIKIRHYLFKEFMKSIVESSTYKLNFINFNIEGIEQDVNTIYISYLIKLLMPNVSNKNQKKDKKNTITGIKLAIFGNKMFDDFCDDKKRFPYAIITT
eukprot:344320_1